MRQTLKIQIPDEKTFLMVIPLWSDHAFWAGKTSHYNHNAGRVNLYKFDPVEASGWPGNNVANPSVKFDDAAGGGFYSDNINPQKKFILNNINGSGSQTGDITIIQDTWGQYNGTNTGSIPKLGGYAKSLDNLNKKNALSRTPLSCNLKFFILALNDSAEALVLLLSK